MWNTTVAAEIAERIYSMLDQYSMVKPTLKYLKLVAPRQDLLCHGLHGQQSNAMMQLPSIQYPTRVGACLLVSGVDSVEWPREIQGTACTVCAHAV